MLSTTSWYRSAVLDFQGNCTVDGRLIGMRFNSRMGRREAFMDTLIWHKVVRVRAQVMHITGY